MQLIEAFRLALQSLWANKMRSILTLLGVIIGVASVITVVTLTNGAKEFVTSKINSYGAAIITISKMPQTFITMEEYLAFQKRRDVTYDDYRAVLSECRSCESVGAQRNTNGQGRARHQVHDRHEHSRLDLDHARSLQSEYRAGPVVYRRWKTSTRTPWRSWAPTLWITCWAPAIRWEKRFAWMARPTRDRRGRTPGQDAGHEHGQLGCHSADGVSAYLRVARQPGDLSWTRAGAAR